MTNDITILSCPQCGFPKIRDCGNGLYQCDDCEAYFDKNENIILTEQEWLQTASTEQLAELITDIRDNDIYANNGFLEPLIMKLVGVREKKLRKSIVVEWLKQPHREERHDEM